MGISTHINRISNEVSAQAEALAELQNALQGKAATGGGSLKTCNFTLGLSGCTSTNYISIQSAFGSKVVDGEVKSLGLMYNYTSSTTSPTIADAEWGRNGERDLSFGTGDYNGELTFSDLVCGSVIAFPYSTKKFDSTMSSFTASEALQWVFTRGISAAMGDIFIIKLPDTPGDYSFDFTTIAD